jgi:broad specificity phosphatase PhoE
MTATVRAASSSDNVPMMSESSSSSSSWMSGPVVDVFPHGADIPSASNYTSIKTLYYIRHAQGTHNVLKEYRDRRHVDARLTDLGKQQCRALASAIQDAVPGSEHYNLLHKTDLVVTSPLTRCIQTTLLSLEPLLTRRNNGENKYERLPILAHESIRETVNYNCDQRRTISEISKDFEQNSVDFNHIEHDHDPIWEHYQQRLGDDSQYTLHRESAELHKVAHRGRDFFMWLAQRPETHVTICSHAAFSRCLWNWGVDEKGVPLMPPQHLDDRHEDDKANPVPIVNYHAGADYIMRKDFDNCELRSVVVAFRGK